MTKTAAREKYAEIKLQLQKLRDEYETASRAAMKEGLKNIFDTYPRLMSISWTQYTPYFCDGDPCHFGVNDPQVLFEGDEWDDEDEFEETYEGSLKVAADKDAFREIKELFAAFEDDDFEMVYGDHALVKLTREETVVGEYDHD